MHDRIKNTKKKMEKREINSDIFKRRPGTYPFRALRYEHMKP